MEPCPQLHRLKWVGMFGQKTFLTHYTRTGWTGIIETSLQNRGIYGGDRFTTDKIQSLNVKCLHLNFVRLIHNNNFNGRIAVWHGYKVPYTKELLQESLGSIDIDAGDAAVASQHAIHCGGDLPPVVLCFGVESCLNFCYVPHPAQITLFTHCTQTTIRYLYIKKKTFFEIKIWFCRGNQSVETHWPEEQKP